MSGNLEGQLAGCAAGLDVGGVCVRVCVWSGERWESRERLQDFSSEQLEWQGCHLLRREGLGVANMNLIVDMLGSRGLFNIRMSQRAVWKIETILFSVSGRIVISKRGASKLNVHVSISPGPELCCWPCLFSLSHSFCINILIYYLLRLVFSLAVIFMTSFYHKHSWHRLGQFDGWWKTLGLFPNSEPESLPAKFLFPRRGGLSHYLICRVEMTKIPWAGCLSRSNHFPMFPVVTQKSVPPHLSTPLHCPQEPEHCRFPIEKPL